MNFFIGFLIAVAVGLTGIGGGSFTVPALVLIVGLTAGEAGLLLGTLVLRLIGNQGGNPVVIILLGVLLAVSSSVTFVPRAQNPGFARKNSRWLPWLALPIGVEYGFSSAGAGALGSVLLLNYSEITTPQVVGTDLIFGLVLAAIGGAFHWKFGAINSQVLVQLLAGGIPGVVLGCALARHVPARKLKLVVAMIAILAGVQLVWNGTRTLLANRDVAVKFAARHQIRSSADLHLFAGK